MTQQGAHIVWTSDMQRVFQDLQKSHTALEKQVQQLRKVNRAGKGASKSVKGIGAAAVGAVAGFVSLHVIIGKVNQALQQQVALRREASGRIESEEENLKRLIQISGGDLQKFTGFRQVAATLVQQQGMAANEALGLVFQGASLGFSNEQIVQMGEFKKFAKNIGPLFEAIAGLQAAFGKGALGGDPRGAMNALLAAAEQSKVSVEVLAGQALTPAQAVKMKLGGTAAETLAALSVLAVSLKSPEEAATALGRFADVVGRDKRFEGQGLIAAFETMEGLSPKQRKAVIGENVRAARAMAMLENMDELRRVYAEVKRSIAATGDVDRVTGAVRLADVAPPLRQLTTMQRAREAAQLAKEEISGTEELPRQAVEQAFEQMMEEFGFDAVTRAIVRAELGVRKTFGLDPLGAARPFRAARPTAYGRLLELLRELGIRVEQKTGSFGPSDKILRLESDAPGGAGRRGLFDFPGTDAAQGPDAQEAWQAMNELMDRQGWSRLDKVRAWKRFRGEEGIEIDPGSSGNWLSGDQMRGQETQRLREIVDDFGYVVDELTEKLRKLSNAAENVTVNSEPME